MLSDQDCRVCADLRREAEASRADVGDLLLRVQIHELEAHQNQFSSHLAERDRAPRPDWGTVPRESAATPAANPR
ncbi:hypothetical protein ACFYNY_20260 [Streptomyces sp. NPDC006530]|uniref:hypothetical protein n=1 Tax=Streptomyces sp. NPDC006530 TaxID=3364750 RepID=UPI0036B59530